MSTNQPGKPRVKFIDETGTDMETEGHAMKFRPEDESVNRNIDSTEGHAMKARSVDEAEVSRGRGVTEADGEGTEGHVMKGKP